MRSFKNRDIFSLLLLSVAVFSLFLPALAGWRGIFQDDQAMAEFPWHYFLARHFQAGEIPRWEPDTWCGAIPFYARYYADTYYFPLWPLYLLADTGNPDHSYLLLALIPLLFHYLLASAGMYFFGRRGMELSSPAAFLTSWAYVFSPAFSYSYVWLPIVTVQAWLPWLLLVVVRLDRRFTWRSTSLTAAIIALMALAAQPPHLGYGLLLAFLLAAALGIRRVVRGQAARAWCSLAGLSGGMILSILLSAVYWFSLVDGMSHTEQHIGQSYQDMTGADGSMPPLYLVTLFSPEFFNTVTGGRQIWGGDISFEARYWEANLQGGLFVLFLALGGLCLLGRGRRSGRFWALFAGFLFFFSVLCVLGRHTPFYHWFYRLVPFISRFPFPIRFRLLECIAVSWLCGLGLERLREMEKPASARRVWGYLGFALLAVTVAGLWPQDFSAVPARWALLVPRDQPWMFPGLSEVWGSGHARWFLFRVAPGLLGALLVIPLAWRALTGRTRTRVVLVLVVFETFIHAAAAFYYGSYSRQFPLPQHQRVTRPENHRLLRTVVEQVEPRLRGTNLRWASDRLFLQNFARLTSTRALQGYDMKPLESRFKQAQEEAYGVPVDWPIYWSPQIPPRPGFLSSMSVACFFSSTDREIFPEEEVSLLSFSPPLYLHTNPGVLPPAYFQDRLILGSVEEQKDILLEGRGAEGAYLCGGVEGLVKAGVPVLHPPESPPPDSETAARFLRLQQVNQIKKLDVKKANLVEAEVLSTIPAMLVFSEVFYPGWRARLDGAEVPVYRVNYLQRGVWVPAGEHVLRLTFSPFFWILGAWISLLSWLGLGVFYLLARRRANLAEKD